MTPKLGEYINGPAERDAVHVAISPVRAKELMGPANRVGISHYDGSDYWVSLYSDPKVGIIDPFLGKMVPHGERVWICLFPETVTAIKHHWSHPAFDAVATQTNTEKDAIKEIAKTCGVTLEELVEIGLEYSQSGEYDMDNRELYKDVSQDQWKTFWDYMVKEHSAEKPQYEDAPFTCSC
jgi:hypothetical protein